MSDFKLSTLARSILAGGVSGSAPIDDPRFVLVGDSLTMFNSLSVGLNGVTITRNAAGVLNVAKSTHQVNGSQPVYLANMNDPSYEVFGYSTYVDANNFTLQSDVLGAAGSTTGQALGVGSIINRMTPSGLWLWLQSKLKGGGRLLGNYGQGGDRLDQMTDAMTKVAATAGDIVIINGGINDLNQSATAATIIARMQAHVDTLVAAGKRVCIVGITPLGSTWPSTEAKKLATIAANAGFLAMAAANPAAVCYADAYTPLADPAYQGAGLDGRAYSWATYDGIHWAQKSARLVGGAVNTAVAPWVTVSSALPATSTDLPVVAGYTAIKQYGPWTGAGGGFNNTGSTGTVQPRLQVFPGPNTTVNSLVDRGADGFWQRHTITPGGSGGFNDYIQSNAGETLASLGLTTSDEVFAIAEVAVSNGEASGFKEIVLHLNAENELQGKASAGGSTTSAWTDAFEDVLVAGPLKLTASTTKVYMRIGLSFAAASANVCTVDIGRIVLYKKNP